MFYYFAIRSIVVITVCVCVVKRTFKKITTFIINSNNVGAKIEKKDMMRCVNSFIIGLKKKPFLS